MKDTDAGQTRLEKRCIFVKLAWESVENCKKSLGKMLKYLCVSKYVTNFVA